jgi:hypothetical protein
VSTTFVELPSGIWNALYAAIQKAIPPREVTFGQVVKRDEIKQLVWVREFGDVAIPLVYFGTSFEYLDTTPVGNVTDGQPVNIERQMRGDKTQANDAYHTKVMVPKVGQMVCVLNPRGAKRFPMCIGVIHGTDYWQGES